jgi:hypothetical protein
MSEDPRDAEIRRLREQESAMMQTVAAMAGADSRDLQLGELQARVKALGSLIERLSSPPAPTPQEEWTELPNRQRVPPEFIRAVVSGTPADREAMGFRWDGNKPVFPAHWPRGEPGA